MQPQAHHPQLPLLQALWQQRLLAEWQQWRLVWQHWLVVAAWQQRHGVPAATFSFATGRHQQLLQLLLRQVWGMWWSMCPQRTGESRTSAAAWQASAAPAAAAAVAAAARA
jgi:hypothetical protein